MSNRELTKPKNDITGKVFSRLTVIKNIGIDNNGHRVWECLCSCGNIHNVLVKNLTSGDTKSCGCLNRELSSKRVMDANVTHGLTGSGEYRSWLSAKNRCYNKVGKNYSLYGGRGIFMSDEWVNNFELFLSDMGSRPINTSLDRIDNDKGYSKENCRWATRRQQSQNKRNNVVTADLAERIRKMVGSNKSIANSLGVKVNTVQNIRAGKSWIVD